MKQKTLKKTVRRIKKLFATPEILFEGYTVENVGAPKYIIDPQERKVTVTHHSMKYAEVHPPPISDFSLTENPMTSSNFVNYHITINQFAAVYYVKDLSADVINKAISQFAFEMLHVITTKKSHTVERVGS